MTYEPTETEIEAAKKAYEHYIFFESTIDRNEAFRRALRAAHNAKKENDGE